MIPQERLLDFGRRHSRVIVAIVLATLTVVAAVRVVATYRVFSNTMDEPYHVAAGLEWLERGTFAFAGEHPPLGRIAAAVGPYLSGARLGDQQHFGIVALEILFANDAYARNLFLARLGMLVFFLLGVAGVFVWTLRLYGVTAALMGVALFTTTPPVLAHAGLATTDIPLVGTLLWTVFALTTFVDRPSVARGAAVGLATGFALVSKMSAVIFVPTAVLALVATRLAFARNRPTETPASGRHTVARSLLTAGLVAPCVVWPVYRFSVGRRLGSLIPGGIVLLAPAFFEAVGSLLVHNAIGHAGYLLGEYRTTGWWYFFPFALAVKTPIPFLVLTAIGTVAVIRHARATGEWQWVGPIAVATAIVLVSMPTRINIGLRHVLPIYPLLAMTAAYGFVWMWRRARGQWGMRALAAALVAWQVVSSSRAHPDYLAYFNELAGRHPERVLLDSDLDWGQDLLRLADTVRVRHIQSISVAYFGSADGHRLIPAIARPLAPGERTTGWIAASETFLSNPNPNYAGYRWLNNLTPVARVGKSMKLFYVQPGTPAP